ncbi:MAG: hypothetical protein ACOYJZ_03710 [Acutalibacter sp.]|jgi:hypothetical protein
MKKNRFVIVLLIVLVVVTAGVAVWHNTTRVTAPQGTLRVESGDAVTEVPLDQLQLAPVQGTIVNGKGEETTIEEQGVLLSQVLEQAGISEYTQVEAVADDEYSATVTKEEIDQPDKVYLLVGTEERPRLVVFGDENSKRNVSSLIRLVVT